MQDFLSEYQEDFLRSIAWMMEVGVDMKEMWTPTDGHKTWGCGQIQFRA